MQRFALTIGSMERAIVVSVLITHWLDFAMMMSEPDLLASQ
jgi:hypothetical protein